MFSISHDDNCSSPNTHDPSSSQMHKNVHQNLSFKEHSYALAMIMMMMTMMSRVQLCWCLNSVLHLIQLCPKNLSPNFSSLHCNVISFPTLHWIEMLLHCRLLCTWLCIALSWAEPQKRTMVKSTHVERWLYHLIFFHWAALQALTLRLSQALVLLVACSGSSYNFLYGGHYTRDGHYHLGNRFPLQLLQKPLTGQLHWHSQDQLYHLNCDVTEPEGGVNLNSKW